MDTELSKAEWLEFHAAACADALQRFPDAHPDIRQYLSLVIMGEYPADTPHHLYPLAKSSVMCWVICSARDDYRYARSAARNYCEQLLESLPHKELPDELKAYHEPE